MDWIINRLKEESTWRGIIAFAASVAVAIGKLGWATWLQDPATQTAIIAGAIGIIGLINIIKKQLSSADATAAPTNAAPK